MDYEKKKLSNQLLCLGKQFSLGFLEKFIDTIKEKICLFVPLIQNYKIDKITNASIPLTSLIVYLSS